MNTATKDRAGATLAADVRAALQSAPYVPSDSVDVEVRDHAVYLSGTVGWGHQRIAAERAVASVDGVHALRNHIRVRPHVSLVEAVEKIEAALADHGGCRVDGLEVDVDGGCVTLSGTVASYVERLVAERAAAAMPHVRSVRNRLRIVRA